MDYYDYDQNRYPIHYECLVYKDDEKSARVKKKAFQFMKALDGWCSEQKAGILIDHVLTMKPTIIVEIGVFGGKSLIPMACALKENGIGKIYGIDPWSSAQSSQGMEGVNKEYWDKVDHEAVLRKLITRIDQFNLNDCIALLRYTSEEAPLIENIEMLHIDGNHSEKTSLIDVTKWVPLVKEGGLIIFDDINWQTTGLAVQWLNHHCTKIAEYRGDNIWGIWIKNN